jgi:hypothetical protein
MGLPFLWVFLALAILLVLIAALLRRDENGRGN